MAGKLKSSKLQKVSQEDKSTPMAISASEHEIDNSSQRQLFHTLDGWCAGVDPKEHACHASDFGLLLANPTSQRAETSPGSARNDTKHEDSGCTAGVLVSNDASVQSSNLVADVEMNEEETREDSKKEATQMPSPRVSSASTPPRKKAMLQVIQEDQRGNHDGEDIQDGLSVVENEDEEEQFDLIEVLSYEKIQKNQVVCSGGDEGCTLLACSVWASSVNSKKWYYCVDCQKRDFNGWPESRELPISHMEQAHKQLITKHCSRKRNCAMPSLPPLLATGGNEIADDTSSSRSRPKTNFVTPPPNSLTTPKDDGNDSNGVGANNKSALVKQIIPQTGDSIPAANTGKPTASAIALATHKKWQEEAERLGTKDSRIIIDRKVAKKVIFDTLHDLFRPTNITDLYQNLKAVIPSPVLSACLHEMSMDETDYRFTDSDDDAGSEASESAAKNKKLHQDNSICGKDPFAGLLKFKSGKNSASSLWYVDYNKLTEMDSDERQKLAGNLVGAKAEFEELIADLKRTRQHSQRLLSEPTSDRVDSLLAESERTATELQMNVENTRKLRINENDKKAIKKDIARMTKWWRERRKVVVEFLVGLEENTEGQVTMKRCLAGDGPITVDSDEGVVKAAISSMKDKRNRDMNIGIATGSQKRRKLGGLKTKSKNSDISLADESFVAVRLNSQGSVERIYALDE